MKKINIFKLVLFLLVIVITNINAQADSVFTFKLKEFDISFSQINPARYPWQFKTGFETTEIEKNNSITFLNDSLIRVSNKSGAFNDIKIKNIEEINFKTGKNSAGNGTLIGAGLGSLLGFVAGTIIYNAFQKDLVMDQYVSYVYPISISTGLIIGGIIGFIIGNADTYKDYNMQHIQMEKKKKELTKIAARHKR